MAAYLLCLTTGGGVPLFTRTKGDLKPLPFPVIGSLNAVHMFASNHGVALQSTTTETAKIVWRVFMDSITLIVVTHDDNAADCHLNSMLEKVFNAMVLLYGMEELANIKNVERFKKEIKVCLPLVDALLEQGDLPTFHDLTGAVDSILAPECVLLQSFLDAFMEAADSQFGCLIVHGKIAVATKKWWSLSPTELVLLLLLVSSALPPCSSQDIPVYLPQLSPKVPHRLLTFTLLRHIQVCVLCGPTPSLAQLEVEVDRFWKPSVESLRAVSRLHPRNFTASLAVDPNILGFILVNLESHRSLCSVDPVPARDLRTTDKTLSTLQRQEILRAFYKKMVGTYFSSDIEGSDKGPSEFSHQPQETYIVTDRHKCYAMLSACYQIFILFNTAIPTFAMRSVTQKTLQLFTKDKNLQV